MPQLEPLTRVPPRSAMLLPGVAVAGTGVSVRVAAPKGPPGPLNTEAIADRGARREVAVLRRDATVDAAVVRAIRPFLAPLPML